MKVRQPEPGLRHPGYRGVRLTEVDAHAGWLLSSEADWNQTANDWRFLLTAGSGFGFEDDRGALVASAVLLPYGQQVAWVGMVLVTASARRQGLATLLLRQALRLARSRRLPLLLDATAAGRQVYRPLGFRELGHVTRWRGGVPAAEATAARPPSLLGPIGAVASLDQWAEWDAAHFGADRRALLQALMVSRPELALQFLGLTGERLGYCLGRAGREATQIGPLVARTETVALTLLGAALDRTRGPVLLDVVDGHARFEGELSARGFRPERSFVRMALGLTGEFGRSKCVLATAGPEFG